MLQIAMVLTQDVNENVHTFAVASAGPVALFLCVPSIVLLVSQFVIGSDPSEERIERELQMCAKRQ